MSNKIEDFYLVYDFKGGDDYIPNCLNHDTTDIIFEQGGRVNGIVMEHYFKNYVQIPVMVENLNVHWDIFEKTTINILLLTLSNTMNSLQMINDISGALISFFCSLLMTLSSK